MPESKVFLFRMIIPAFPRINIFSKAASTITALGPVLVATSASKMWGWRVEIIDENNYRGPRDKRGLPDHEILQKENPADLVGFYTGLSSTIERVWELAEFYKKENAKTVAGAWHSHFMPEETLRHNIDLVIHGDAELAIQQVLTNIRNNIDLWEGTFGVSFLKNNEVVHISLSGIEGVNISDEDKMLDELMNSVSDLGSMPFPDFGLLRFAKMKVYPVARTRGCGKNCEFCSVKGKARWASAFHLFNTVKWLVEARRAKNFMIVDDRLEEDLKGTLEFFRMISKKFGRRLNFLVQIRLEAAKNDELLKVMADAGVRTVAIGYESPIDEDLIAMRKGYLSKKMIEWTKIIRKYFWIHAMFIFGYPPKDGRSTIGAKEMMKRFKAFVRKCRLHSIQIMKPCPGAGTDLRKRLKNADKLFSLRLVPWKYYDGNWVCFEPENMKIEELQEIPLKIMRWFYSPFSFFRVCLRTAIFPLDYVIRGWNAWKSGWKMDVVKSYGSRLIRRWQGNKESAAFLKNIRKTR